jgi:hypothetical protein
VIGDVLLPELQSVPALEATETELPSLGAIRSNDDSEIPE